jgi:hypothetical protein
MKKSIYFMFAVTLLAMMVPDAFAAKRIIADYDMGDDCDDIGGHAVLLHLMDLGECEVIACGYVGNWNTASYGPTNLSVINTWYGYTNIPVGRQLSGASYDPSSGHNNYGTFLATQNYPNYTNNVGEDAYRVYRRALVNSPDNSVTMVFHGQMSNLRNLYNSTSDDISALTGAQLVSNKVAELVLLAGQYPSGTEFDLNTEVNGAQIINSLASNLLVTYSGYNNGYDVFTRSNQKVGSPVRDGYDHFFQVYGGTTRESWGAFTTIYAVRGLSYGGTTYFTRSAQGSNRVDAAGANTFTVGGGKNQYYLSRALDTASFTTLIQGLQDAVPAAQTTTAVVTNYPAIVTNYTQNGTNWTAYIFTNSGYMTFAATGTIQVLVVGGGGGGGNSTDGDTGPYYGRGAGGGAGGLIYSNAFAVVGGSNYTITVGAGGRGGDKSINVTCKGENGANSAFGSLVAVGGGGGAGGSYNAERMNGANGGSGGGAWYSGTVGNGTTGQGKNGGPGYSAGFNYGGGGGGGAATAGQAGSSSKGGDGGAGLNFDLSGATNGYAGGGSTDVYEGSGADKSAPGTATHGGGTGNNYNANLAGTNARDNSGGGGGSCGHSGTSRTYGHGGSGIVIVRYLTPASQGTVFMMR